MIIPIDKMASAVIDVTPWENSTSLYISRIFVPYHYRCKGYGTKLMETTCGNADKNGQTLYVHPTANYGSNVKRLIKFFEKFGFKQVVNAREPYMVRMPSETRHDYS